MKLESKYKLFIHKNAFENVVWEMAAILARGILVNIPEHTSLDGNHPSQGASLLTAITVNAFLALCHLFKLLQLIRSLGAGRWICRNLLLKWLPWTRTVWQGTRAVMPGMATWMTCPVEVSLYVMNGRAYWYCHKVHHYSIANVSKYNSPMTRQWCGIVCRE